jgi:hypothetical protein
MFDLAINVGMPLLIPKSFDLGYDHAADAELRQCIPHFFELEWLNDGDHEFHRIAPSCRFGESGGLGLAPTRPDVAEYDYDEQNLCRILRCERFPVGK